jgi:hypothetical protein
VVNFPKSTSDVIGGFLEIIERLFERVSEFSFKSRCCAPYLAVRFSHTANHAWQSFGSENHQSCEQEENYFASAEVEHSSSIEATTYCAECAAKTSLPHW